MSLKKMMFAALFASTCVQASTVEENRLGQAQKALPHLFTASATNKLAEFTRQWKNATNYKQAKSLIEDSANDLWDSAKQTITSTGNTDDRGLYWHRLALSKVIRTITPQFAVDNLNVTNLLEVLEKGSRGKNDLSYTKVTNKRILLTGFDPFLLDLNIKQSNPSGSTALLLDDKVISYNGITAEINTVMIPVRYQDFDQGEIEALLAPYYALNNIDMIVTVSMGRAEFDLERFPGKRRSRETPGNANMLSGGNAQAPVIPRLNDRLLPGPEFVEFSLPVAQMQRAIGQYKVNDNRQVTTLTKSFQPNSLADLDWHVAVSGSGGGYLSNEISYRSIRLRNSLGSNIPTGHIHTPRIKQFDSKVTTNIAQQIKTMLRYSLIEL
jgi:pyrrolidone-carboxylate peptidase